MKRYDLASLLLAVLLALPACRRETTPEETYFRAVPQNESGTFEMGHAASSLTDVTGLKVFVYSNTEWTVSLEMEEGADDAWIDIYPTSGKDDGRFYINVTELSSPYPRTCRILFRDGEGKELSAADFIQNGTEAYLIPDQTLLSYGSSGGTLRVDIDANVLWEASVLPETDGDDVSWCTLGERTASSLDITAAPNTTDDKRSARIRIAMTGREEVHADIPVTQLPVYSIRNAELLDIAKAVCLEGVIEDNVKIQGFVISDRSTDNYAAQNDLFLQDDSGAGIIVKLPSADDNIYPEGTRLCVWMTGGVLQVEEDGLLRLSNIPVNNLSTETTLDGDGAVPVVVSDLSTLPDHPYTLVTLQDVYFPVPVGTLCNVGTWKNGSCSYALTPVIDGNGNPAVIRTLSSFTDKYARNLSRASFDITGIVLPDRGEWLHVDGDKSALKRMDGNRYTHTLRLRKGDDLRETDRTRRLEPIVYWQGINTTEESWWVPAYGEGSFNLVGGVSNATKPNNTARVSYSLKDVAEGAADSNCWPGYSTVTYWDAGYGGLYYELTANTAGRTGAVVFSFQVGAWGSAPRYMKVQYSVDGNDWTDLPDGRVEFWNAYSSGTSAKSDYTRLYAPQAFSFVLPGTAGASRVGVRLTTQGCENKRADGSASAVSNSSSFNLFYFAFSELR